MSGKRVFHREEKDCEKPFGISTKEPGSETGGRYEIYH